VNPPIINTKIKEADQRKGISVEIDPWYIVETQLNTLMALGMATRKVKMENVNSADRKSVV